MISYFESLSNKYQVTLDNIISIALNRYGISSSEITDNRTRFNVNLLGNEKKDFFAVCVNTYDKTPFKLQGDKLFLNDTVIGKVSNIEKDTCTSTYFRNNKKTITFNSNSRSKCTGCKFCGTYSIDNDDEYVFSNENQIKTYFDNLLYNNQISGMDKIENITVCTGCFENEEKLFEHLMLLNETFNNMNFKGTLGYIGSQLRNFEKITKLKEETNHFAMLLSIEKFIDRDKYMKKEKASLTLKQAKEILSYCSFLEMDSTFLYILGLENLETMEKYFPYFKNSVNKFPIVQVFQNYEKIHEIYRTNDAKDIEFYLKARKLLSETYKNVKKKQKDWECYRSLYYNKETKENKKCRIKK